MKKKRLVALALVMTLAVSASMFVATKEIAPELLAAEEITRKIFGANAENGEREQEVLQASYLQGLDEESDYIIVNSSIGGYAIFERAGMELIEYSDKNASPYAKDDGSAYYAGPTNYFKKENEKFKHIYTGEKFEKAQMREVAKTVKERIKENRTQRKGKIRRKNGNRE